MTRILTLTLPVLLQSIPFSLIITLIMCLITHKKGMMPLFWFYLLNVFYITILSRHPTVIQIDLMPLATLSASWHNIVYYLENIIMFIPYGFFLNRFKMSFKKAMLIFFFSSLLIEVIQVVFSLGYGQMDDLIGNVFGGALGYGLSAFLKRIDGRDKV